MSKYKGYSQNQNKATQKYLALKMERIQFWLPKGLKAIYKQYAENQGKSLTKLITDLLDNEIKKGGD